MHRSSFIIIWIISGRSGFRGKTRDQPICPSSLSSSFSAWVFLLSDISQYVPDNGTEATDPLEYSISLMELSLSENLNTLFLHFPV